MEFKKFIYENKNYKIDFISAIINELIILFGIFSLISYRNKMSFQELLLLFFWYIFTFLISEMVNSLEIEIRTNNFINLISSKTSIFTIYLKRSLIWILNASIYFIFTSLFFVKNISFTGFSGPRIFVFSIHILLLIYLIYLIFLALTVIFERTSTFVAFFNSLILVFGLNIFLVKDLYTYSLGKAINFLPIYGFFGFLLVIELILKKKMTLKIFTSMI